MSIACPLAGHVWQAQIVRKEAQPIAGGLKPNQIGPSPAHFSSD